MTPKLESYKRKLQTSLMARFYLRFHVSLILIFSIFCGWLSDLLLLKTGLNLIILRYPLAVVGAYAAFMFAVWVWIEYSGIREYVNERKCEELIGDDVSETPEKRSENYLDWLNVGDPGASEGCITFIAVLLAAVIIFYFFGGYLLANAAVFFAEIVVELLLAAGLLRGLNRVESSGWMLSVMNATFWSFIFTLSVAVLFGWWALTYHHAEITLGQIIAK